MSLSFFSAAVQKIHRILPCVTLLSECLLRRETFYALSSTNPFCCCGVLSPGVHCHGADPPPPPPVRHAHRRRRLHQLQRGRHAWVRHQNPRYALLGRLYTWYPLVRCSNSQTSPYTLYKTIATTQTTNTLINSPIFLECDGGDKHGSASTAVRLLFLVNGAVPTDIFRNSKFLVEHARRACGTSASYVVFSSVYVPPPNIPDITLLLNMQYRSIIAEKIYALPVPGKSQLPQLRWRR